MWLQGGGEYYSGDLLSSVTPSPLWGPGTSPEGTPGFFAHVTIGSIENTSYLGIVPLILAGFALFAIRRTPHRVVFWALVFLFFSTLALGPYLYIGDAKEFSVLGASFSVPLPYQIFREIPVLGVARAPARMIPFATVGLALLAGIGFGVLTSWLGQTYKTFVPVAAILVLGVIVLEYWNPPVSLYEPPAPAILKTIRDDPGDFSVLNLPFGRIAGGGTRAGDQSGGWLANYHQTIHGKATVGGAVARAKRSDIGWVWEQPGLRFLACHYCTKFFSEEDTNPDIVRQLFREQEIKYVVQKAGDYAGTEEHAAYLTDVVGLKIIFADSVNIVYLNLEIE